jgi:hypothetical protein
MEGTLTFGDKQIGEADGEGKVKLRPQLVERWFSTADDPFQGKRKIPVTLQGKPNDIQLEYVTLWLPPAGLRVRLASPEVSTPLGGTIVEVKLDSVVVCVDNSSERKELWPKAASTGATNPFEGPGPWKLLCAFLSEKPKEKKSVGQFWRSKKAKDVKRAAPVSIYISIATQHAVGKRLVVLHKGKLTDATVTAAPLEPLKPARHGLKLASGAKIELDLNEFNHCVQRFESVAAYHQARLSFREHLRESCATVQDGITGTQLKVEDQTLQIKPDFTRGVRNERWMSVAAVKDLAPLLLEKSTNRQSGAHETTPAIVEAGAGTGKANLAQTNLA